ncbi:phosphatidylglycerophosphatase A [Alphaproteobacteria bacterium]|nr:phosphatidylglycerophosphatase A [Alphaproteobacteria bacterium]
MGGLGFCPFAPGTVGSVPPIIAAYFFKDSSYFNSPYFFVFTLGFCFAVAAVSIPCLCLILKEISQKNAAFKHVPWGAALPRLPQHQKKNDPSYVVIDEVLGQSLALALVAFSQFCNTKTLLLSFVFFRFFDIFKPGGISILERRLAQGTFRLQALGILADDALAGLYAGACVSLLAAFFPFLKM